LLAAVHVVFAVTCAEPVCCVLDTDAEAGATVTEGDGCATVPFVQLGAPSSAPRPIAGQST
jgi:hypothetical protein